MIGLKIVNPFRFTKGIFYCLLLMPLFTWAQAKAEWQTKKIDFGKVDRGTVLRNNFVVKNTGTAPLVLQDAEVSCGCTTVEFSRKPIMPGQSDTVVVVFNTTTVYGRQDRIVWFYTSASKDAVSLRYKGFVSNK